jgi:flagella basal body P-ring formation protein FlgA
MFRLPGIPRRPKHRLSFHRSSPVRTRRLGWLFLPLFLVAAAQAAAADIKDLVAERAEQEYGVSMPARGYFDVRLAEGLIQEGEYIQEFWTDRKTGQFIANVVTAHGEVKRIWGAAILKVPVPVPLRRILPEEIVDETDIQIVQVPWARLGAFAILDETQLVGMQVRRMLVQGRPVPRNSVIPPTIISRGEKVKIELNYGALHLVANGRAIADAHLGQEVRVVNLSSNKTITAIATADGVVEAMQ